MIRFARLSALAALAVASSSSVLCAQTANGGPTGTPTAITDSVAPLFVSLPRSQRPRIIVQPLEFNASLTQEQLAEMNSIGALVSAIRGGNPAESMQQTGANVGRAAADLLTEQLLATGRFRVLERRSLDGVKAEQDLTASTSAEAGQSVAQRARLLGAKYMITGAITKFGQSKQSGGAAGLLGGILKAKTGGLIGGIGSSKTTYAIGMTVRVVDTETGEVVASMTTDGTVEGDKSLTIAGGGLLGAAIAGGMSKSASGEREQRIAEALALSAANMTVKLVAAQTKGDIEP